MTSLSPVNETNGIVNGTELCKCAGPCCLSPDFGLVRLELLATDNRSLELLATDNRTLELL